MNAVNNPFSPGAGSPPPALVGRDSILQDADILLERALRSRTTRSMLMTGLRGVGKTVMLNKIEQTALQKGSYYTLFLEVRESESFTTALASGLRKILFELDAIAGYGSKAKKALMVLRNFIGTIKVNMGDISLDLAPLPGIADSGDFATDLTDLFLSVADAAQEQNKGVALLIDEMQLLIREEFNAIIMAMHKLQQVQKPLVLIGAGLPTLPKQAGEAKSYAERLFDYPIIGQLSRPDSDKALLEPVQREGATFTNEALSAIYHHSQGYPYFLQMWAYQVWNTAGKPRMDLSDVQAATTNTFYMLDHYFFRVRFDRLTEHEKIFLRAMAELPDGEYKSADIARSLKRSSNSIAPIRDRLIKKGMVYSPRHGSLDFSVPLFAGFLRRAIPCFPPH